MDQYRDAEIVLGPIEKNYQNGLSSYYTVEDRLSGMKYYIEYRHSIWWKSGTLNIVSKKDKIMRSLLRDMNMKSYCGR